MLPIYPTKDYICIAKNGKYGIIDWNNNILLDFVFDDLMTIVDDEIIYARFNNKFGFLNSKLEVIDFDKPKSDIVTV